MERMVGVLKGGTFWWVLFFALSCFGAPWLLLHDSYFSKYFDFSTSVSANVAATIGGILSPVFSLWGSVLVYSALKEQQKANKIASLALKMSRAQADSAQVIQQIQVLESLKDDTIKQVDLFNFTLVMRMDTLIKSADDGSAIRESRMLDDIRFQIHQYITEYEITVDLLARLDAHREIYYRKLYFAHDSMNTAFVEVLDNVSESSLFLKKSVESSGGAHALQLVVLSVDKICTLLNGVIASYRRLDLAAQTLG